MLSRPWSSHKLLFRRVVFRAPVLWTRQFHPSLPKWRKIPKANSTLDLEYSTRTRYGLTLSERDHLLSTTKEQIPVTLLHAAAQAGLVTSGPKAIRTLTACVDYTYKPELYRGKDLRTLLEDLDDLHSIAVIGYIAFHWVSTKTVGAWMVHRTCELGVPSSINFVATGSLKLTTPKRTEVLDKLEVNANRGDDPQAMVIHGTILQKRGQLKEASELFEKAMEISEPVPSMFIKEFTLHGRVVQPWAAYGAIKGNMGDQKAARKALEIGAQEYENVQALKLLGQSAGFSKDWDKYLECITKVAMTGDAEACFYLGSFYLKQHYEESKENASKGMLTRLASFLRLADQGPRSLALEWFRVAAEYGHPRSALIAAGLLREDRKFKEGVLYLDTAQQDKSCSESAKSMRYCFLDRDATIDLQSELPTKTYEHHEHNEHTA